MGIAKRKKISFDLFYQQNFQAGFNLLEKLEIYCEADVVLLTERIVALRQTFIDLTEIELFECSQTISNACMKTYSLFKSTRNSCGSNNC